MAHRAPPPLGRFDEGNSGVSSLLPVSNDRMSSLRDSHARGSNKRPRTNPENMGSHRSRSPPGDGLSGRPPPDLYLPEQPIRFSRQIRQQPNMPPPHSHQFSHHDQMHNPGQNFSPQYTPMFPVASQGSTPPSFIPLQSEYPGGRGHPSQPSQFPRDMGPRGYGPVQQYEGPMYPGSIRHQQGPPPQHFPPQISPINRDDRGGMFNAFLEADERSRIPHHGGGGGGGGGGLDWPTHDGPPPRGDSGSRGAMEAPNVPGLFPLHSSRSCLSMVLPFSRERRCCKLVRLVFRYWVEQRSSEEPASRNILGARCWRGPCCDLWR